MSQRSYMIVEDDFENGRASMGPGGLIADFSLPPRQSCANNPYVVYTRNSCSNPHYGPVPFYEAPFYEVRRSVVQTEEQKSRGAVNDGHWGEHKHKNHQQAQEQVGLLQNRRPSLARSPSRSKLLPTSPFGGSNGHFFVFVGVAIVFLISIFILGMQNHVQGVSLDKLRDSTNASKVELANIANLRKEVTSLRGTLQTLDEKIRKENQAELEKVRGEVEAQKNEVEDLRKWAEEQAKELGGEIKPLSEWHQGVKEREEAREEARERQQQMHFMRMLHGH